MKNNICFIIYFRFLLQILGAVFMTALILTLMSVDSTSQLLWAVGAGSLASTVFIIFTLPNSLVAEPRRIVGGYLIAFVMGSLVHLGLREIFDFVSSHFILQNAHVFWISGAVAMGLAMILMVLLDSQHPPAAGFSLVLVLGLREYYTLGIILLSVFILALIKYFLAPWLMDLNKSVWIKKI